MAAARQLVAFVHAQKDGETKVFAPGDDVPADWAKVITNPKAWSDGKTPSSDAQGDGDQNKTQAPVEPPRSGSGSGDKAWVAYGEAVGLDVSTGKKADIIAALDARNAAKEAADKEAADADNGAGDDESEEED